MKIVKTIGKLGLTGAIIAGIGFVALTQDPQAEVGDVKEAEADIGWLNVGDDGHSFTRAIAAAGMEPRPYDLNGNRMYFASGRTEQTPDQVEATMQKIFVEQGVNEENHTGLEPFENSAIQGDLANPEGAAELAKSGSDRASLMMKGEVIPIQRRKGYTAMAGYDWRMSEEELIEEIGAGEMTKEKFNPDHMIKGYKFLDATWEPASRMTSVTSVWTDQEFDAKKMKGEAFQEQAPDPDIPSCMGCERDFRFQSLAGDEPYNANQWHTDMTVDDAYEFYSTAMATRGWRQTKSQAFLDKIGDKVPELASIQGKMLNLEKDGKSMVIALLPDGKGGTQVMSTQRYSGAKSILDSVDVEEKRDKRFFDFLD